jgi:hypothetical protein
MKRQKFPLLRERQIGRVTRKNIFVPIGALGEVIHMGVGAKARVWYGMRFMCQQNPDGFMDVTIWEGQLRPLTRREAGQPRKGRRI